MTHELLTTWSHCMTAQGLSARTVDARVELIQRLSRAAGVDPDGLTREHVLHLLGRRRSAQWTRVTYYSHLQAWAAWVNRPDLLDGIRRPKSPRRVPDPLAEDDLAALLEEVSDDPLLTAWVLLGAFAGLRAGETAALEGRMIRHGELRITGKGGRIDVIPMPPVLEQALRPWKGVRGRLWPHDALTLSRWVKTAAKRAGIEMHFHQLRHRFGTAIYRATRDLLLTQHLMRHSNASTTAGYAALVDDAGVEAVHLIPGAVPGHSPREGTCPARPSRRPRPWSSPRASAATTTTRGSRSAARADARSTWASATRAAPRPSRSGAAARATTRRGSGGRQHDD